MKYRTILALVLSSLPLSLFAAPQLPVTHEEQEALTPDAVIKDLLEGNQHYVEGKLSDPNIKASIEASAGHQYPKAIVLSCIDSRVLVEEVFDQGIGDIFVGRVAGNVENDDLLGSMEFATQLEHAKVVMVLGHESCGAVKGACDGAKLGHLTELLEKIRPAVDAVEGFDADKRTSKNPEFVAKVVDENARHTAADIRKESPILEKLEKEGKIKIVAAVYSLHTGKVTLLD